MAKTRFNIFTAEEFDDTIDAGGDAEVSAVDAVESEAQAVEMEEEVAEVQEVMASTEEAEEVVDELSDQVEEQEQVIEETPEEVTDDTVAVAQEQFYISISKIRCLKEYTDIKRGLSTESANTPVEKLKLSCEGVIEFIKVLCERIKLAFMKVGELIKKLYVKFVVFFTNLTKKADALSKELNNVEGSKTVTLKDEQIEKISKLLKCFIAAGIVKSTADLPKVVQTVSEVKSTLTAFINDVINKGSLKLTARTDAMTKLAITKDANVVYAPYYVKGTVKAVTIKQEDDLAVASYTTVAIENDGKVNAVSLNTTELKNVLSSISKAGKDLKGVIEAAKSAQDKLYKNLDEVEKTAGEKLKFGTIRMGVVNEAKLVRRAGTNVLLDIVLNYIYNMKNVLAVSAVIAKELLKK